MDQSHIGIIGYGVVGRNMQIKVFPWAHIVDPKPANLPSRYLDKPGERHYRVAFICVPTDSLKDGAADTSIVRQAIKENDADVFVVKSTVPPGTCLDLGAKLKKHVVFSPEYFGGTQHANAVDHNFVILGGPRPAVDIVAEEYKTVKDGSFRIMKTDTMTAELVKYAENAFLATKVTFFAEFHRLCNRLMVDTDEFRELLLLDERIGRSHSFTYRDHPYYDSHCLNKDLPALAAAADGFGIELPFLKAVIKTNEYHRQRVEEGGA